MSKEVAVKAKNIADKSVAKAKDSKPKVSVFKKIGRFFKDLKSEFKKIVWPTKKQVLNNTGVVLLFMGLTAIAIWSIDWIFAKLFSIMY